jgi:hypothetical protein
VADIFEEVDEDLKQENYKKLWDRYGRYIIAVMVLIVAGTAGHVGWKSYVQKQQLAYSERFNAAIDQAKEGNLAQASGALAQLAGDANAGYAMLARFREAALRRENGEAAAAVDIYDTLADDGSIEPLYRSLASLLAVMAQLETGDPAALTARLKPLAADGPWRHTANEYFGVLALRQNDVAAARTHFQAVADDAAAPQGARQRAAELLQTLTP